MRFRIRFATALVCTTAVIAIAQPSLAQSQSQRSVAPSALAPLVLASAETPAGKMQPSPASVSSPTQDNFTQSSWDGGGYYSSGCAGGLCGGACCDQSCGAQSCCSDACGCDSGCCSSGGRLFFTADYLYVHPSFSDANAFIRQDLTPGGDIAGTETFVPLGFGYNSSFRVGGGYRTCACGDEIRFMFTRFNGDASATALPTDILGFTVPPGARTDIRADVDANIYDLECVKIIPLGGRTGGCGDCCGKSCPAWDVGWSGGVRWADVGWNRSYVTTDETTDLVVRNLRTGMDFQGGGIRTGLEGRRYFGCDGWLSFYGKGNVSLLLGDLNITTTSVEEEDPNTTIRQTFKNRQLIPVFDLEAGVTAQVTCHTAITAGYLMSAWSDLGFRNAFEVCDCGDEAVALLPTHQDDANVLGFDGLFVRVEYAF